MPPCIISNYLCQKHLNNLVAVLLNHHLTFVANDTFRTNSLIDFSHNSLQMKKLLSICSF
jgi:hypothetical protein